MCGRYSLQADQRRVAEHFGLAEVPNLAPRYNVAPTQEVPVVRVDEAGQRRLDMLRWGLVPYWATDPSVGNRMINARSETLRTKPAFRALVDGVRGRARRCVVPADGFFEWRKTPKGREPYHFHLRGGGLLGMAGLWDRWVDPEGRALESFTVLTMGANELVRPLHDRMPVILRPQVYGAWLDPGAPGEAAMAAIVEPMACEAMECWPVSAVVNRPEQDVPACVERVE